MSRDDVAVQMGYHSSSSMLKPYDERMLKAIMLKVCRTNLFFDDIYGILLDVATPRRLYGIFRPLPLRWSNNRGEIGLR
ncbi:hypothetical protein [Legionella fairfieldensis]|uniref:hypothetical protein n=1 Tax=Legionella fairfieldensis TaxID=45064 RepID=UPI0010410E6E|nr:hypothetical protein [Legionella fairfieldensis]